MKLHITSPQYSPIRKDWLKQVVFGLSNTYKHANILIAKRIERFQLMTSQEKDTCSSILPKIFCTLQNVFPQLPNVYTHWDNWPLYDWNNKFELSRDKNKRFKNLKIFWYFASRLHLHLLHDPTQIVTHLPPQIFGIPGSAKSENPSLTLKSQKYGKEDSLNNDAPFYPLQSSWILSSSGTHVLSPRYMTQLSDTIQ